jgi:hypothetical protein
MDHLVGIDDRLAMLESSAPLSTFSLAAMSCWTRDMMPLPAVGASMIAMSSALV